mgnify:CR=1 FL=1
MVTLVTYLPFYRIHEINEYFMRNVEILKPKNAIAYIDNVFHERQKEIINKVIPNNVEVKLGNWRNRNNTWLTMLKDFHSIGSEIMVVDSDNVVEPVLIEVHEVLSAQALIYTILEVEVWRRNPSHLLIRSRKIGDIKLSSDTRPVYAYKVYDNSMKGFFRSGSIFFIGPKQVVTFMKLPEIELINRVERAINQVDPWLRNFISDETLLGVIAYLMGVREVPWTVASHHHHHGSTLGKATELLVAAAHYQFAKALYREFHRREFTRYRIKYLLSTIKNLRNLLSSGVLS